jgi:hypothetical protein
MPGHKLILSVRLAPRPKRRHLPQRGRTVVQIQIAQREDENRLVQWFDRRQVETRAWALVLLLPAASNEQRKDRFAKVFQSVKQEKFCGRCLFRAHVP